MTQQKCWSEAPTAPKFALTKPNSRVLFPAPVTGRWSHETGRGRRNLKMCWSALLLAYLVIIWFVLFWSLPGLRILWLSPCWCSVMAGGLQHHALPSTLVCSVSLYLCCLVMNPEVTSQQRQKRVVRHKGMQWEVPSFPVLLLLQMVLWIPLLPLTKAARTGLG